MKVIYAPYPLLVLILETWKRGDILQNVSEFGFLPSSIDVLELLTCRSIITHTPPIQAKAVHSARSFGNSIFYPSTTMHPAVSTMASNYISGMNTANNQVYLASISPQQAFADLSLKHESFIDPKNIAIKSNLKRKRGAAAAAFRASTQLQVLLLLLLQSTKMG